MSHEVSYMKLITHGCILSKLNKSTVICLNIIFFCTCAISLLHLCWDHKADAGPWLNLVGKDT